MTGRLQGKTAFITGGASGMGAATAQLFVAEGARVIIGDRQVDAGKAIAAQNANISFVRLDVASEDSWKQAIAEVGATFDSLNILVQCAGITGEETLEQSDLASWQKVIDVDQTGIFLGMKLALPLLLASGNASVVNISSVFGIIGSPTSFSYHAAKAAMRVMGKSAALEFARRNLRVNTIFPGLIKTPILDSLSAEQIAAVEAGSAMGRIGVPNDIAYGALYLASDEANYVSGIDLVIDGAWLAGMAT